MAKENTAVFIGHNECYGVTKEQVKEAIISLIEQGVTDFLSGGQGGFDRLCGLCVYEVKKDYPQISIIGCKIFSVCNVKNIICIFYKIKDI